MPYFEGYNPFVNEWGLSTAKAITLNPFTNSSPVNGQMWSDGTNLFFEIGGKQYTIGGPASPANNINYQEMFFLMGA